MADRTRRATSFRRTQVRGAFAAVLVTVALGPRTRAYGDVDLTGPWTYHDSFRAGTMQVAQSGSAISITFDGGGPVFTGMTAPQIGSFRVSAPSTECPPAVD